MEEAQFAQFLAQRRRALGLTQEQLARQIHVTGKAISKWECGGGLPDVKLLTPLAAALGTTVDGLLRGELDPKPEVYRRSVWRQRLQAMDWKRLAIILAALLPAIVCVCPLYDLRTWAAELAWRSGLLWAYLAGAVFLIWITCLRGRHSGAVFKKTGRLTAVSFLLSLPVLALDGLLVLMAFRAWPALPLAGKPMWVGRIFRLSGCAAGIGLTAWFLFLLYHASRETSTRLHSVPLMLGSLYAIVVLFGLTSSISLDGGPETVLRTCLYAASLWLEGLLLSAALAWHQSASVRTACSKE
ncbi:MAG: helix-turn-helix transcriptional regulator [Oscillospiraceae bacterium]|nr:helix-turn-helix transcriptional regulator [Oscillospiraceae bacterium]